MQRERASDRIEKTTKLKKKPTFKNYGNTKIK